MQKIAFGLSAVLSALLVIAAASKPSTAQSGAPVAGTEIQATAPHTNPPDVRLHMHPRLTSARAALIRSYRAPAEKAAVASRSWQEDPSLMDASWRLWPSLVDF